VAREALPRSFYARHPVTVARALLGRLLVREERGRRVAGRIVETEAYRGPHDPASHAFRGRTPRNAVMFGAPGHTYVYFTYGMHHCLNLVAEGEGHAAAVLIRALEPVEGLATMRRRRGVRPIDALARGPGCVTRALGLTLAHNGLDVTRGPLFVAAARAERGGRPIARGPRIGLTKGREAAWRFWLAGHPCVSGRRGSRPQSAQPRSAKAARPRAAKTARRRRRVRG
jgi:DNA-3-methyladenine glycosylase